MKLAIYVLFLAAASTGAPSPGLKRNMPIGHAENTLAENQKQTSMKIQNEVTPWIQHLENILKLSIERQHKETSQLYKYIEALEERIAYLKSDTDENLKALQENTKENLISLQTMTNWNDEKILEATMMNSMKHPDTSLNTGKSGSNFTEKLIFPPIRFSPCLPIQLSLRQPELLTLRLTVLQKRLAMFSTNTTPAPYSTKPPCIVGALKNC